MSYLDNSAADIHDVRVNLRRALDAADITSSEPEISDDGLVEVLGLRGSAAARLCVLLAAGAAQTGLPDGYEAAGLPSGPTMSTAQTMAVRQDLERLLGGMPSGAVSVGIHCERPVIHLTGMDMSGAAALTSLIRSALSDYVTTARDLHAALQKHGLEPGLDFTPGVKRLKITLGEASVEAGAVWASILDGEPVPEGDLECAEYPEAQAIADRLEAAVEAATDGGRMEARLLYYCERCSKDSVLDLGSLPLDVARRLVTALQSAEPIDVSRRTLTNRRLTKGI
ncbi:hypothetical protein ACIOUE_31540 [Streptomyces xanthochromogenes]|uniref:hypothetical protein n=1 Tax=Streptomyces xanthochromogenes TaxID=67384 RepID=UPI00380298F3